MTKFILYPRDGGGVQVLVPTGAIPIGEVARKDVPSGVPFLLVAEAPGDGAHVDFSAPHGFGIGHQAWTDELHEWLTAVVPVET